MSWLYIGVNQPLEVHPVIATADSVCTNAPSVGQSERKSLMVLITARPKWDLGVPRYLWSYVSNNSAEDWQALTLTPSMEH